MAAWPVKKRERLRHWGRGGGGEWFWIKALWRKTRKGKER